MPGDFYSIDHKEVKRTEQKTGWDSVAEGPKSEKKTNKYASYSKMPDGRYRVNYLGAFDLKRGYATGEAYEDFDTEAEAQAFIDSMLDGDEMMREHALELNNRPFSSVKRSANGGYEVIRPGLIDVNNGNIVGTTAEHADTLEDAAKMMQEDTRSFERVGDRKFMDIELSGTRFSFSTFDDFRPSSTLEATPAPLPDRVAQIINSSRNLSTFEKTKQDPEWSKHLFMDLQNEMDHRGSVVRRIAEANGIKNGDLRGIDPRQAIAFTTELVMATTLYDYGAINGGPNPADNMSAMELLHYGMKNIDNKNRKPLGVCRNFADMEKAIFEAIKVGQGEYSKLKNTYIVTIISREREDFGDFKPLKPGEIEDGHEWNNYIQVSSDGTKADMVQTDVTWGKYDLENHEIVNFEQSNFRTFAFLRQLEKTMPRNEKGNSDRIKMIGYFNSTLDRLMKINQDKVVSEEMMGLLLRTPELFDACNDAGYLSNLLRTYARGQFNIINKHHLKVLAKIKMHDPRVSDSLLLDSVLKIYFSESNLYLKMGGYEPYIVDDDPDLQAIMTDYLKRNNMFDQLLAKYPKLRERFGG